MKFAFILLCIAFSVDAEAQSVEKDSNAKRTDSIARKVIHFFKNKQPDSVYAMTGKDFREKITAENFNAISNTQILAMNNFDKVSYVNNTQGVNKYKVEGTPNLQLMIGLDADNKIGTLLVQPFGEDKQ